MDRKTFDNYHRYLMRKAADKRREKESEYFSTEDLLGNFRKIAAFRDDPTPVTIMNLGAKPLQSISDMVDAEFANGDLPFSQEAWDEKFVDSINYLIKLYGSIRETRE